MEICLWYYGTTVAVLACQVPCLQALALMTGDGYNCTSNSRSWFFHTRRRWRVSSNITCQIRLNFLNTSHTTSNSRPHSELKAVNRSTLSTLIKLHCRLFIAYAHVSLGHWLTMLSNVLLPSQITLSRSEWIRLSQRAIFSLLYASWIWKKIRILWGNN